MSAELDSAGGHEDGDLPLDPVRGDRGAAQEVSHGADDTAQLSLIAQGSM